MERPPPRDPRDLDVFTSDLPGQSVTTFVCHHTPRAYVRGTLAWVVPEAARRALWRRLLVLLDERCGERHLNIYGLRPPEAE